MPKIEIYQEWHYPCEFCHGGTALAGCLFGREPGPWGPCLPPFNAKYKIPPTLPEPIIDFFTYSPEFGLWGLGLYSFLAATLLPGGSEIALLALLGFDPHLLWPALAVATLGNTAGGLTSWWCGRVMPVARRVESSAQGQWLIRWGSPLLPLSWLPIVGDLLCVAAGWLRLNWLSCGLFMAVGKALRYGLVAYAVL